MRTYEVCVRGRAGYVTRRSSLAGWAGAVLLAALGSIAGARGAAAQAGATVPAPSDSAAGSKAAANAGIASGAGHPDSSAGSAAAPGGRVMTLTVPAAVGGSIAADSAPALAPPKPADSAAGRIVAKTPDELRKDSLDNVQRLELLYPSTVTVPLDRVAAVVGDEPILWSEVIERVNVERSQGLNVPSDSAGQDAGRPQRLE